MPIGYEGYAKLDDVLCLCTGASVPRTRNRLDSASAYKGEWVNGIQTPHNYDWDTFDGSISFEVTQNMLSKIKKWLNPSTGRYTSKSMLVAPRTASATTYPECYWNSISFTTGEGSLVTGSVNFISVDGPQPYTAIDSGYIGNRTGVTSASELVSGGDIPALNLGQTNLDPIPFWKTSIISSWTTSGTVEPISWTLTFNQDVQRIFTCGYNTSAQEPDYIGIGQITADLQVDLGLVGGTITLLNDVSSATVVIGGVDIGLGRLELTSNNDEVQTDFVPVSATYDIYGPLSV